MIYLFRTLYYSTKRLSAQNDGVSEGFNASPRMRIGCVSNRDGSKAVVLLLTSPPPLDCHCACRLKKPFNNRPATWLTATSKNRP